MNEVEKFKEYRSRMNEKILSSDKTVLKRLFNLDSIAYRDGSLDSSIKEFIGLACSLVFRCDDCVKYHLEKYFASGITNSQVMEVLAIADLVGGIMVIPHPDRAVVSGNS